jgi:hypothetical protein
MKCEYWVKKEALSVLNLAKKNSNRKKLPVRIYCEDNSWYLTSSPPPAVFTIEDDLQNVISYWSNSKNHSKLSKEQKEMTQRVVKRLSKLITK